MILLVRAGTKYTAENVLKLLNQFEANDIVTLTDQADTPRFQRPLKMGWPGWWSKMELFAPWNESLRPALYIDLDSLIFGAVEKYDAGNRLMMVKDFNNWVMGNSSVMWLPKDTSRIWNAFLVNPKQNMAECGGHGDQLFIQDYADGFWDTADGIVSYKNHGKQGQTGTIMQFHGQPKPWDAGGWATDYYDGIVD